MPGKRGGCAGMFGEWGASSPVNGRPQCGGHTGRDPTPPARGDRTLDAAQGPERRGWRGGGCTAWSGRRALPSLGGGPCGPAVSCAPGAFSERKFTDGAVATGPALMCIESSRRLGSGDPLHPVSRKGTLRHGARSLREHPRRPSTSPWQLARTPPGASATLGVCHPCQGPRLRALTPAGRRPPHLCPLHRPENCACVRVYSPRPPCEHLDPHLVGHFGFSCLCACHPLQRHPYCDHPPTPGLIPLPRAHCHSPALTALFFALSYNDLLHVCQVALPCVRACPVCMPGHSGARVRVCVCAPCLSGTFRGIGLLHVTAGM